MEDSGWQHEQGSEKEEQHEEGRGRSSGGGTRNQGGLTQKGGAPHPSQKNRWAVLDRVAMQNEVQAKHRAVLRSGARATERIRIRNL